MQSRVVWAPGRKARTNHRPRQDRIVSTEGSKAGGQDSEAMGAMRKAAGERRGAQKQAWEPSAGGR